MYPDAENIISLLEANYKVMVCDVQPGYSSHISFDIFKLIRG